MDLEEHTLESVGDRCEECGAHLTDDEKQAVLENGGPNLCSLHAAEVVDVSEDPSSDPDSV